MAYSVVDPPRHGRRPTSRKIPSATKSLIVRMTVERPHSIDAAMVGLDAQTPPPLSLARSAK